MKNPKKIIQVVMHCLPREIDQLERVCNLLRESYFFIENKIDIILDITLNLNSTFVDWNTSTIPKEFFIEKFNIINKSHMGWTYKNIFDIEVSENKCLGINDKRRNSINDGEFADYIMYLDLDVFFSYLTFIPMVQLLDQLNSNYNIISLETVKLWDDTWGDLVNSTFTDENYDFFKYVDPFKVNKFTFDNFINDSIGCRIITPIKFGGGWFNIFSKELLRFISIPETLGSYGQDDTFIMSAANLMTNNGYNITQYILSGCICIENVKYNLYKYNPYEKFITDKSLLDSGRVFKNKLRKISNKNFETELIKFNNRI